MSEDDLFRLSADADSARRRILSGRNRRLRAYRLWEGAEWELERRVLASRPVDAPPTAEQRRFLSLLQQAGGTSKNLELADHFDLHDPKQMARVFDAEERGWVKSVVGGIGGIFARPAGWCELTAAGETALNASETE